MFDRSEKKCLIASMGGHVLTLVFAMLGTAFFSRQPEEVAAPEMKFIPIIAVEEMMAGGGGNPKLPPSTEKPAAATAVNPLPPDQVAPTPPPVAPAQPEPVPTPPPPPTPEVTPPTPDPEPEPEPEPPKVEIKPTVPKIPKDAVKPKDPKKTEPKKNPEKDRSETAKAKTEAGAKKPVKPQILIPTNNIVVRDNTAQKERERKKREAEAKAREEAEKQYQLELADYNARVDAHAKRRAGILGAVDSLGTGLSKDGVKVEVPGPGGLAYANYGAIVRQAYDLAWRMSSPIGDDDRVAEATVVLLRSGEVLSARISKRSGFPVLDKSVEAALNRVKRVRPFPDGAKDEQRSFTIEFSLKAKRQSG